MAIQFVGLALALAVGHADPAWSRQASPQTAPTAAEGSAPDTLTARNDAQAPGAFTAKTIGDDQLAALAGGQEPTSVAVSSATLSATNTGNTINTAGGDLTSGSIGISGSAISGYTGMGNFVFNTGNNNNLQGSITVNILMAP